MEIRTLVRLVIFLIPTIFFLNLFIWGENGILSYLSLRKEIEIEIQSIETIKKELAQIHQDISNLKNDAFYFEKLAREDLLMGKEGEFVYLDQKKLCSH